MAGVFINIFRFFRRNRMIFFVFLLLLTVAIVLLATRIRFEENISGITGDQGNISREEYVLRNFQFAERIVIHLRPADSLIPANPDTLEALALEFERQLLSATDSALIKNMIVRLDDTMSGFLRNLVLDHLPVFLTEADYATLDSLTDPARIPASIAGTYRIFVTPAGMAMRDQMRIDPLGITGPAMKKLRSLQVSEDYTLRDGFVFTPDYCHLLIFVTPSNPPGETEGNSRLVRCLNRTIEQLHIAHPEVKIDYFGSPAVAAGNADRIKKDIILTLLIAISAIVLIVGLYFRNLWIRLTGFLPALFGVGFALAILYLVKGTISAIALGIGSVILGLILDYALYIINHYFRKGDPEAVLKELTDIIILCALTSIGAFLCLTFLKASVLHDLGWFAALSITGAALFTLVIFPHFLGIMVKPMSPAVMKPGIVDRFGATDLSRKWWALLIIGILATGSLFFRDRVSFEPDMNSLNYMSKEMLQAQTDLEKITPAALRNVYIVSTGQDLETALRKNQEVHEMLERMKSEGLIKDFSGVGSLLISDSVQSLRIARWNSYWSPEKSRFVRQAVRTAALRMGFSGQAFDPFDSLLLRNYRHVPQEKYRILREQMLSDWIVPAPEMTMISAVGRTQVNEKQVIYDAFRDHEDLVVFDRQNLTSRFVASVKEDFEKLVNLSMIFVCVLLLLSFGRIELAVMTAIPMFLGWFMTLGFMGITGIRFNIFNIIISSFIFGLGVDYSILLARGLLAQYKSGTDNMPTYRISILLSSATMIFGVAALFFAKHPALHSIALISVVGILSVVLATFIFESLPARWFLLNQQRKKHAPVPLRHILLSIFIAWIPISSIALILVIYGSLVSPLMPVTRKKKQEVFHRLFAILSRWYIKLNFPRHNRIINPGAENFEKPAVIITNHQSLIETPALLRLYPRILIMTNDWVFHNFVFGPVARLAGFIPVQENVDKTIDLIRSKVEEGYSILIFPEGHRSADGHIQRFHRGAFYIAEKLRMDIIPIVIFGSGDFLRKGNFWGHPNRLYMKILPRIHPEDTKFGAGYSERTRQVRRYYREQYKMLKEEMGTPDYYASILQQSYLFKGPVLEWYVRVKRKLEQNFITYHELLPRKGDILDLGCGYGYITLMLMLCSEDRMLTGVDYDEEKITVAAGSYLINDHIRFIRADVMKFDFSPVDGILLGDVLHYIPYSGQETLLERCTAVLRPGGVILIREADAGMKEKHKRSRLTEFLSTHGGFNKTQDEKHELYFTSETLLRTYAQRQNLSFEIKDTKMRSSNRFFILKNNSAPKEGN